MPRRLAAEDVAVRDDLPRVAQTIAGLVAKTKSESMDNIGNIRAMARLGTTLYVVGGFFAMAGVQRRFFAAFDLVTGGLLPWNPLPPPTEEQRAQTCTEVGGFGFSSVATDGQTIFAGFCGLVAFDALSGAPATNFTVPRLYNDFDQDTELHNVVIHGDTLCVDGSFNVVSAPKSCPSEVTRRGTASFNRRTGDLLPL